MFTHICKILLSVFKNVFAPMHIPLGAQEPVQNCCCFLWFCSGFGCVFTPSPGDSGRAVLGLKSVRRNEEGLQGHPWQELTMDLAWSSTEEGILLRRGMFRSVLCVHLGHQDGSGD